jgi:hypothetical protein
MMKVTIWEGALPIAGFSSIIASRGNGFCLREVRVLELLLVLGRESSEIGHRNSIFKISSRQFYFTSSLS